MSKLKCKDCLRWYICKHKPNKSPMDDVCVCVSLPDGFFDQLNKSEGI